MASGDEFPLALERINGWLTTMNDPFYILDSMIQHKSCERCPVDAWDLLYLIINKNDNYKHRSNDCLEEMGNSNPNLNENFKYVELSKF
ncbi:MAG: hypothetical protein RR487_08460 [Acinetobacter sp.]